MNNFADQVRKAETEVKAKTKRRATQAKQPKAPSKIGRHTNLTPELADIICNHICDGLSLRKISKLKGMPHQGVVCRWLADPSNVRFREQYARAREAQAELMGDELVEIADDAGTSSRPIDVQRSRLMVDARKWMASKLLPKKYGDLQQHSGPGGGPIAFAMLPPDENERRIQELLSKANGSQGSEPSEPGSQGGRVD